MTALLRLARRLLGFHRKLPRATEAVRAPRHSPTDEPTSRQLGTGRVEVDVDFVPSLQALVDYARTRDDQVLLGDLRRMRTAFEHWLATSALEAGPRFGADIDEAASELIAGFRRMVNLGVERRDPELLSLLGQLQAALMAWPRPAEVPA